VTGLRWANSTRVCKERRQWTTCSVHSVGQRKTPPKRGLRDLLRSFNGGSAPLTLPPLARSCALNPGCVAAAPCVVHLQVAGLRIGEESLEHPGRLSAFTDFGIDHHVLRVEGADSQEPRRQHLWDDVDSL